MGLLFPSDRLDYQSDVKGFDRYRLVLEKDWAHFIVGGLLTTASFIPFALGMIIAILTSSLLVAIVAGVIGGMLFGPFMYALCDGIFRSLRQGKGPWMKNYFKAVKAGWKTACVPGMVFGLFLSAALFAGTAMLLWANVNPSLSTLVVFGLSLILAAMVFTTYWPQLVLFEQSNAIRLKNCALFCLRYFWSTFLVSLGQVIFWVFFVLLLPWSAFFLPLLGLWLVLFVSFFLLYERFNEAYGIESKIRQAFPGQMPVFKSDLDFHVTE